MTFFLEIFNNLFEMLSQFVHSFQIMFGQGLELLNCVENVNQFEYSSAKKIELSEYLSFREIESFSFRHIDNFFFGFFITVLVFSIKFNAVRQNLNKTYGISQPNFVGFLAIENPLFTVCNHLVGNFHEQTSHFVSGVEESGNSVNHFNGVHKGW